jgi:hypothetical protein
MSGVGETSSPFEKTITLTQKEFQMANPVPEKDENNTIQVIDMRNFLNSMLLYHKKVAIEFREAIVGGYLSEDIVTHMDEDDPGVFYEIYELQRRYFTMFSNISTIASSLKYYGVKVM